MCSADVQETQSLDRKPPPPFIAMRSALKFFRVPYFLCGSGHSQPTELPDDTRTLPPELFPPPYVDLRHPHSLPRYDNE